MVICYEKFNVECYIVVRYFGELKIIFNFWKLIKWGSLFFNDIFILLFLIKEKDFDIVKYIIYIYIFSLVYFSFIFLVKKSYREK